MVKIVHFDSPAMPESVVGRVEEAVKASASRPEFSSASPEHIVKESVKSIAETVLPPRITEPAVAVPASQSAASPGDDSSLPGYLSSDSGEVAKAVTNLVGLVFSEGLDKAIEASRKHDPFIEDAFHDALVEKLVPELKKRGIL